MATDPLRKTLRRLHDSLAAPGGGLTDGQLLARFVAGRDEAAFEALVHRHGPMVLSVCRRLMRDAHDAEDAFQGAFLVLARKAASVVKRDSVGSWLYAVAYRTALEARAVLGRRRLHEKQMDELPHPQTAAAEVQDWRPLLDRELAALPEKYRAPVVLYHLEGHSHRDTARQLGLPEGTLAGRLARARRLLAVRLARHGVTLGVGVLLVEGAAGAVPASLVRPTVQAASLVRAGTGAALTTPAAILMKGALKAMLLQKVKIVTAMLVVGLTLGAGGLAYRAGGQAVADDRPRATRPLTEVEALRREVELLKINLEVVLEKVRAQESELRELRGKLGVKDQLGRFKQDAKLLAEELQRKSLDADRELFRQANTQEHLQKERSRRLDEAKRSLEATYVGAAKQAEEALKALRQARDPAARERALGALETALKKLMPQRGRTLWRLEQPPDRPTP
jgi:RNA polymerase sigma factor (sigma-70 family)